MITQDWYPHQDTKSCYCEFVIWMCWVIQETVSMISGLTCFLNIELIQLRQIIQIIIIQCTK